MPALVRLYTLLTVCFLCSFSAFSAPVYFVDGDGDQVPDQIDDCPYTHPGVQVDAKGCPLRRDDADLDGVPDDDDDCPYTSSGAVIDVMGCALDSDFDGIANGLDHCPDTPLAQVVNAMGCALGEREQAVTAIKAAAPLTAAPATRGTTSAPNVSIAAPILVPVTAVAGAAEAPRLLLRFDFNGSRLDGGDLAAVQGYAKIFARQLASSPAAVLQLKASADRSEADVTAVARMVAVRKALVGQGIAVIRIRTEIAVSKGPAARSNRSVEAEVVQP